MTKTSDHLAIIVLNGPNLNLLGTREPDVYGCETLADIEAQMNQRACELADRAEVTIELSFRQSNNEADLVSWIGSTTDEFDGIVINPAALTHTSISLLDAINAVKGSPGSPGVPCIEVHLSNTLAREDFRHRSITGAGCIGQIMGLQSLSYVLALEGLVDYILRSRQSENRE